MATHTARLPENLDKYIQLLISKGYATSYSNAINMIIMERMIADKQKGDVTPFKHTLTDRRVKVRTDLTIKDLDTDNVQTPVRMTKAAPVQQPAQEGKRKIMRAEPEEAPEYGFNKASRPTYPGSRAEYEEGLRNGTIKEGMFEPPDE